VLESIVTQMVNGEVLCEPLNELHGNVRGRHSFYASVAL
jgi:hypothetical protein